MVDTSSYTVVATARGQRALWFRMFGSYQGEWLLLSRDDNLYYVYKDWYGSCSGCDALEAESSLGGEMAADDPAVQKFIAAYRPFLEMKPEGALEIAKRDGNLLSVIPANLRDFDGIADEVVGRQLALVVKAEEGDIEALEILELDNMETRREAIERYGTSAWVFDTEAVEVDVEGPNRLCRIERPGDPFCFLDLLDGSTDRRYVLRVAPEHKTVQAARASSFGFTPEEFVLTVET